MCTANAHVWPNKRVVYGRLPILNLSLQFGAQRVFRWANSIADAAINARLPVKGYAFHVPVLS
jgi:hypothetical protein